MNHHNYNLATARTVIKDYKSSVVITNKVKTSHTESTSKSVNRRKVRKEHTLIQIDRLVHTPAWKMIYTKKRSRESDDQLLNATKWRKLNASKFNVEPDEQTENNSCCLKNLFGLNPVKMRTVDKNIAEPVDKTEKVPTRNVNNVIGVADAVTVINSIDKKFPDQNENLVSYSHESDELMEYEQAAKRQKIFSSNTEPSSIDSKSKMPSVVSVADNFTKGYKLPETKFQVPVDVKFNLKCHVKIEDNSFTDPIDIVDVKPTVVVQTESKSENVGSAYSYDAPITTYAGQLLWAQYFSYPYWPAIVCETDTDTTKDTSKTRMFHPKPVTIDFNLVFFCHFQFK